MFAFALIGNIPSLVPTINSPSISTVPFKSLNRLILLLTVCSFPLLPRSILSLTIPHHFLPMLWTTVLCLNLCHCWIGNGTLLHLHQPSWFLCNGSGWPLKAPLGNHGINICTVFHLEDKVHFPAEGDDSNPAQPLGSRGLSGNPFIPITMCSVIG